MPQGPAEGDSGVYAELMRLGERIVDIQFKIMLDRIERTDRLIQLGVATVAGMIAVVGLFLTQGVWFDLVGAAGIGTSFLFVVWAVYLLARLSAGLHRNQFFSVGPNLDGLSNSLADLPRSRNRLLKDVVDFMPLTIDSNVEMIGALSARQDRAVLTYGVGVAVHMSTIAYILGRLMFV